MFSALRIQFTVVALSVGILFPLVATSQETIQHFTVGQVISDGKAGRVWNEWKSSIPEGSVDSVSVVMRRDTGGADTYINLRYENGQTFENGKRVYLHDTGSKTVFWNLKGEAPNGRALILNAHNGEVFIEAIEVKYRSPVQSAVPTQSYPAPGTTAPNSASQSAPNQNTNNYDPEVAKRCRWARIRPPRIEIGRIRPGAVLFGGKFKAEGSIYGNCIEEAGYFENGRLKERFDFPFSDRYQRKDFSVEVRTGKLGEIRLHSTDGKEDRVYIDEEIVSQGQLPF